MHEFEVSLRLGEMVFVIFRIKQSIWKEFRNMELDLERFGLWLKNWIWKVKRR